MKGPVPHLQGFMFRPANGEFRRPTSHFLPHFAGWISLFTIASFYENGSLEIDMLNEINCPYFHIKLPWNVVRCVEKSYYASVSIPASYSFTLYFLFFLEQISVNGMREQLAGVTLRAGHWGNWPDVKTALPGCFQLLIFKICKALHKLCQIEMPSCSKPQWNPWAREWAINHSPS